MVDRADECTKLELELDERETLVRPLPSDCTVTVAEAEVLQSPLARALHAPMPRRQTAVLPDTPLGYLGGTSPLRPEGRRPEPSGGTPQCPRGRL